MQEGGSMTNLGGQHASAIRTASVLLKSTFDDIVVSCISGLENLRLGSFWPRSRSCAETIRVHTCLQTLLTQSNTRDQQNFN